MQNSPETQIFPRMHVSLYVSNLDKTIAFYQAFFGQVATKVQVGYAKFILKNPTLIISFIENPSKVQAQFGHLGFQVDSDSELKKRLLAAQNANLVVREEMGTSCCYAVQDKFWVSDPDGFQWEVYVFKEDAEFNDPHYANSKASACCMPSQKSNQPELALPLFMSPKG
jgi:catechol 2,3-dioxygenase-like lactoylglutathione lyase family enzyme